MVLTCAISQNCQRTPPHRLHCEHLLDNETAYFRCVCNRAQSLTDNEFFNARCVFEECSEDRDRQAFITAYKKGCVDLGMRLRDITGEWGMFDTLSSSSTIGLGRTQVSTGPSTETAPGMQTKTKTSTLMEATEMRGSTTRNSITTTATPTTRLVTRTTTVAAVSTISKTPADIQIPICGIPLKCTKPHAACNPSDLSCICHASNSLAQNTQFDQLCVLDACYGDLGREEFLESLMYNCGKVGLALTDVPKRWEVYLPSTYPSTSSVSPTSSSSATSSSPSLSTSSPTASLSPSLPFTTPLQTPRPYSLSTPAIAGTATAATFTLILLALLALLYYRSKKKAKKLRVENAVLVDATHPEGVGGRIEVLMDRRRGDDGFEEEGTLVGSPTGESFGVGGGKWYGGGRFIAGAAAAGDVGMRIQEKNYGGGGAGGNAYGYGTGTGIGTGPGPANTEPEYETNTWDQRYTSVSPSSPPFSAQQPRSPNFSAARRGGSIGPPPASPPPPPPKVPPKVQSPRVYDDEESEYESLRREPRRVVQPTSRSPPPVPPQSRSPRAYDDEAESEYESLRRGIGGGAGRGRRGWDEGRMI
ncbi:hypothetical protein L13192_02672 [Pyrenophora tritici-repentis]|nr:hypothetical protein L13192_02672 [Pyrenophora tritici-repentis]